MNNSNHIVWDFDPVLVNIPEITFPVPISIWGLVIAAALIYFGWSKIKPRAKSMESSSLDYWSIYCRAASFSFYQFPNDQFIWSLAASLVWIDVCNGVYVRLFRRVKNVQRCGSQPRRAGQASHLCDHSNSGWSTTGPCILL